MKLRRIIAAFGHAPALWLFYREALPKELRPANAVAALATIAAMLAAGLFAPEEQRWFAVFVAWVIGHVLWGVYLFAKLPDPPGAT